MPKFDTPGVCVGIPGDSAGGGITPGLSPFPSEDVNPAMPVILEPKGARPEVAPRGIGLKPPAPNSVLPNGIPVPPTAGAALPGTPSNGDPPFMPLSCARAAPLVSSSAAVAASATPRAWRAIPILPTIEASLLRRPHRLRPVSLTYGPDAPAACSILRPWSSDCGYGSQLAAEHRHGHRGGGHERGRRRYARHAQCDEDDVTRGDTDDEAL